MLELTQGKFFSWGLNLVQGAWTLCHSLNSLSSKQVQSKVNIWWPGRPVPVHPPGPVLCLWRWHRPSGLRWLEEDPGGVRGQNVGVMKASAQNITPATRLQSALRTEETQAPNTGKSRPQPEKPGHGCRHAHVCASTPRSTPPTTGRHSGLHSCPGPSCPLDSEGAPSRLRHSLQGPDRGGSFIIPLYKQGDRKVYGR